MNSRLPWLLCAILAAACVLLGVMLAQERRAQEEREAALALQRSQLQRHFEAQNREIRTQQERLDSMSKDLAEATSPTGVTKPPVAETPEARARRLLAELGADPRKGRLLAEIAQLDPEVAWAAVKEAWTTLPPEARARLISSLVKAGNPHWLELIDLGMSGDDLKERGAAASAASSVAFVDFGANPELFAAWRESAKGKPLDDLRRTGAAQFLESLRTTAPGDLEARLSSLLWNPEAARALQDAGIMDIVGGWLDSGGPEQVEQALRCSDRFSPDETWLRAHVVPLLQKDDEDVRDQAISSLGHKGNTWAVDLLTPYLATPGSGLRWAAAGALAEIGDPRAIDTMIQEIRRDNSHDTIYGIGFYGLQKLTGVNFDEKHDAAWWDSWWRENRHRFEK